MKPFYAAQAGRVMFRGRALAAERAEGILAMHRQSASRAAAEGNAGLAQAALALAEELKAAMAEAAKDA